MRHNFLRGLTIVLGAMLIWSGANSAWAGNEKYAFVDVAKLFDNYQKTKDQDKTLQDSGKKQEEKRDALVYDIRQLKDELALMNGDMKNKKQELLEQKIQGLQDFDRNVKKDIDEARSKVVREIFSDLDSAIKSYAEKNGITMVFNEKALLYRDDKLAATDAILAELNKNYKPGKK